MARKETDSSRCEKNACSAVGMLGLLRTCRISGEIQGVNRRIQLEENIFAHFLSLGLLSSNRRGKMRCKVRSGEPEPNCERAFMYTPYALYPVAVSEEQRAFCFSNSEQRSKLGPAIMSSASLSVSFIYFYR